MSDLEDKKLDFVLKHYKKGKFDTPKAFELFSEANGISRKPRTKVLPWLSAAVAAAAVVLCVFLFGIQNQEVELTAYNSVKEFVLPDGSEVALAPGSRLTYNEKTPRKTELEGKAFFEVARNEDIPFEISADGAYVKVLGTKFMVNAAGKTNEVYVTDGKVLFARSNRSEGVILTKDMQAILSESDAIPVVQEISNINSIAWQRGTFIFDNTPLKEVLECLSKHYNVSFVANDLSKCLSGEFAAEDLDMIIKLIESALDVNIIKK